MVYASNGIEYTDEKCYSIQQTDETMLRRNTHEDAH